MGQRQLEVDRAEGIGWIRDGGQPASGVTKHTNVLVIGYQDARKLRPGEDLSAKARKARDLRILGQEIEIVPEVDFVQMLVL